MPEADIPAIVNVINLYSVALDSQRWDIFDRIFTQDVEVDFGPSAQSQGREVFKANFAAYHAPFDSTQHVMTNHAVDVEGDTAHAFTYGLWRLIRRGMEGGDFWEGTGWYDDELVRTKEGWRIKRRVCRVVWWGGNVLVNQPIPGVSFDAQSVALRREAECGTVGFIAAAFPR